MSSSPEEQRHHDDRTRRRRRSSSWFPRASARPPCAVRRANPARTATARGPCADCSATTMPPATATSTTSQRAAAGYWSNTVEGADACHDDRDCRERALLMSSTLAPAGLCLFGHSLTSGPTRPQRCSLHALPRYPIIDWQARRESNPQPAVLETAALPIELLAYACNFAKDAASALAVDGQSRAGDGCRSPSGASTR